MKIGIINELGGHLTELLMLSQAMEGQEVFFVTSVTDRRFGARVHYQIDLHPKQFGMVPLTVGRVLNLIWQSWKILRKEKPDVLISTGAEICLPAFWLSRVLGIKTIFIESVTRVDEPTITGRLAYPVSDVFFVQQPEMLRRYGRRARYEGAVT